MEAQNLAGAKENSKAEGRTIVFIDESGLSEKCPVTRAPWRHAARGRSFSRASPGSRCRPIAGLSWWHFYFRFFEGAIKSEQVIEFLSSLYKQIGRKLLVILDGAEIYRSRKVRAWLEQKKGRIALAYLPPYAPELNPVEAIWAYLKKNEIADPCVSGIARVCDYTRRRLKSMQRRPKLITAFWKQADLAL